VKQITYCCARRGSSQPLQMNDRRSAGVELGRGSYAAAAV
jgi:hypothetical protein